MCFVTVGDTAKELKQCSSFRIIFFIGVFYYHSLHRKKIFVRIVYVYCKLVEAYFVSICLNCYLKHSFTYRILFILTSKRIFVIFQSIFIYVVYVRIFWKPCIPLADRYLAPTYCSHVSRSKVFYDERNKYFFRV